MTETVQLSSSRGFQKVVCLHTSQPVASAAGETLSGVGVFKAASGIYPLSSGAAGVPKHVRVVPCSTTSATYNLTVYGAFYFVDQWLWVPLFKGSVAATLAHTGTSSAASIQTTEYLPATITAATGGPASTAAADVTNYGSGVGPAHALVDTRGCAYLLFYADADNKFVAVGAHS